MPISATYPAAYGQFQQALAQHAAIIPPTQKEGKYAALHLTCPVTFTYLSLSVTLPVSVNPPPPAVSPLLMFTDGGHKHAHMRAHAHPSPRLPGSVRCIFMVILCPYTLYLIPSLYIVHPGPACRSAQYRTPVVAIPSIHLSTHTQPPIHTYRYTHTVTHPQHATPTPCLLAQFNIDAKNTRRN